MRSRTALLLCSIVAAGAACGGPRGARVSGGTANSGRCSYAAELTSVHFSPDGGSILTSSQDQTAILWPAEKIGPSLKFSAARLQIGRNRGAHFIDPAERVQVTAVANLPVQRIYPCIAGGKLLRQAREHLAPACELRVPIGNRFQFRQCGGR